MVLVYVEDSGKITRNSLRIFEKIKKNRFHGPVWGRQVRATELGPRSPRKMNLSPFLVHLHPCEIGLQAKFGQFFLVRLPSIGIWSNGLVRFYT